MAIDNTTWEEKRILLIEGRVTFLGSVCLILILTVMGIIVVLAKTLP